MKQPTDFDHIVIKAYASKNSQAEPTMIVDIKTANQGRLYAHEIRDMIVQNTYELTSGGFKRFVVELEP